MSNCAIRGPLIVALALALALPACGKKSDDNKAKADEGATPAAPSTGETPMTPATGAPAPAGDFDAAAFCKEVFPPDVVSRIVGVDGLEANERRPPAPAGMARCKVEKSDENHMPVAMALLMADCGQAHLDVAKHRAIAKQMGSGKGGLYRDLDMGKGGAYTKTMVLKKPSYTVTFVHDKIPCAVTVSTSFIDADHAEELARAVNDRITEKNYPRP